ncbi:hypothetical protein E1B28_006372 [Marasmius oreades]|uniref:Uncharacterized protein n=1 Tax=Marasmius oreades TaxID=181124 RepID=A0A9P7S5S0_9AGAR|nr:uncharacterized protein E1B28_006372 [Marasmius oreades]KAG7095650.1 hypothetical protein E1B28_006372 [Marasmius oreades]
MTPAPRQSTIYDLTGLRLHPDGTRVLQTENNRRLRVAKQSARDIQGNWIASDAGGSGRVTRYRTFRQKGKERAESGDTENPGENEQQSEEDEEPVKDYRAIKRRKFEHDHDFISPSSIHQYTAKALPEEGNESPVVPLPSSDLLKCIHFMTSQYYHERGQLLNSSREYRRQRKLRQSAKLLSKTLDNSEQARDDSHQSSSESGQEEDQVSGEDEMESSNEEDVRDEEKSKGIAKKKRKGGDRHPVIDMYRTMNGSALMALGMIVQEHIAESLKSRIPGDWEAGLQTFESDIEETEEIQIEKDLEAPTEEEEDEEVQNTQATLVEGNTSRPKSFDEVSDSSES